MADSTPEAGDQTRARKKQRIRCHLSRGSSASFVTLHHSPSRPSPTLSTSRLQFRRATSPERTNDSPGQVDDRNSTLTRSTERVTSPDDLSTSDFSNAFSHICQGYDPSAPHFDGMLDARSSDFLIDLDTDSMERLPDVRAYFFFVGYDCVHEHRRDIPMDPLDWEHAYVRAGRLLLRAERESGRGLFLSPLDWVAMRNDEDEPCAWMDHVLGFADGLPGDAEALGHSGVWDLASSRQDWDMPDGQYPATNVRAPLVPKDHMLIGPGHPDWTQLVVGLYLYHPFSQLGYTPLERQSFTILDTLSADWYSPELVQYHGHLRQIPDRDLQPCEWCDAGKTS